MPAALRTASHWQPVRPHAHFEPSLPTATACRGRHRGATIARQAPVRQGVSRGTRSLQACCRDREVPPAWCTGVHACAAAAEAAARPRSRALLRCATGRLRGRRSHSRKLAHWPRRSGCAAGVARCAIIQPERPVSRTGLGASRTATQHLLVVATRSPKRSMGSVRVARETASCQHGRYPPITTRQQAYEGRNSPGALASSTE
jgi:hypothetical protein